MLNKIIEFYKKHKHTIHIVIIVLAIVIVVLIFGKAIYGLIAGLVLSIGKLIEYKKKEKELLNTIKKIDVKITDVDKVIDSLLVELKFNEEEIIKIKEKISKMEFKSKKYTRSELLEWLNKK